MMAWFRFGVLFGALALSVAAKKPPVNACATENGTTACLLENISFNRDQNRIFFTFHNVSESGARACGVHFLLMREDGKGGFERTGTAGAWTTTIVHPGDSFLMEATPLTDNWHFAKDVEITCDRETMMFHLTYPVFTDWIIERRLKAKLGY